MKSEKLSKSQIAKSSSPAFLKNFEKKVLLVLGEMLQLLKQKDSREHRQQLHFCCQQLLDLGQQKDLEQWVTLLKAAQSVIIFEDNAYQDTARYIIKDIKKASELVIADRSQEIKTSKEIQTLVDSLPSSSDSLDSQPKLAHTQETLVESTSPVVTINDYWLEQTQTDRESAPENELPDPHNPNQPEEDFAEAATVFSAFEAEANPDFAKAATIISPQEDLAADTDLESASEDLFGDLAADTDSESASEDLFGDLAAVNSEEDDAELDPAFADLFDSLGSELTEDSEAFDLDVKQEQDFGSELNQLQETPSLEPETGAIEEFDHSYQYYPWEELESLLEASEQAEAKDPEIWDKLAAFLDNSTLNQDIPAKPDNLPEPEIAQQPGINNLDDQFQDLEKLLEEADKAGSTPKAVTAANQSRPQKERAFEQTMRVPVKQLNNLSNMIGELVVNRNSLEQDQERLRQFLDNLLNYVQQLNDIGGRMHDLYERSLLEGALLASHNNGSQGNNGTSDVSNEEGSQGLDALELDRFTGFHLLSQEIIELIVRVRESSSDIQFLVDDSEQVTRNLRQVTSQLQEDLNKSRMVPFGQAADRLPRAVREVSRKLKKQAQLEVEGRDTLIDKMILEQLYDPMTHLINNAIAHGVESPEVRQSIGKPAAGKITVSAFLQGNQTVIAVSDDGAGIDPEKVKAKAIEKGLVTKAQAKGLSHQDVYDFLFHPGFSTKEQADDFAGRGVGMDVVRTSLDAIRGTISIDSTLGKGTTFTIRLPLTLSICKALRCLSNRSGIAFPMDGVEDMQDYPAAEIQTDEQGQKSVLWRNNLLPLRSLKELLHYNRVVGRSTVYGNKQDTDTISVVVLRGAGSLLAVQVDQVIGEQEIVIKQIEGPVPKPAGVAGATILADGSVIPIGDVLELIEIAEGRRSITSSSSLWYRTASFASPDATEQQKEPLILIVDDSITVRELLSISLGKVGYRVEQARDGQEAWEKIRAGLPCDIVFCDIEMPKMNGLELLSKMQAEEHLADIPVALLTSRGAERHRKVAAELGASGYFTKPYTEKDIIDSVERMLAGEVLLAGSTKASTKKVVETPPVEEEQPPNNYSEQTVLVVDDSVMIREMLSMTFRKVGYQVEQARDGQDAWEKLRSGVPVDVVFCDIEMPRMNGLELLSHLQEDHELSEIPVAMITSRGAERHRKIARERGAKGYFTKPYIEDVLVNAAGRLIDGEVLLENTVKVEN